MTSTWIQSAPPASAARTASPNRAKSADRIDGASFGAFSPLPCPTHVVLASLRSVPPLYPERICHMYRPQNLRIPGPTFVPQAVLNSTARPMINHRGPEFAALMAGLTRALQDFLNTQGDVFLLSSSGSGGMEAAIANTLSRGDRVLLFVNGAFGERFAAICKAYGVEARRVDVPWGRALEPDLVRDELAKEKGKDGAKAVLLTHNETSTGVLNPLKEIAEVVRESGKIGR